MYLFGICVYIHISFSLSLYIYIYVYVYIHFIEHQILHICIYLHVYIYIYIYIYTCSGSLFWGPGESTRESGALEDPRQGPRLGSLGGNRRRSLNVVKVPQILCILNICVIRRVTQIFKMHSICGTLAHLVTVAAFPGATQMFCICLSFFVYICIYLDICCIYMYIYIYMIFFCYLFGMVTAQNGLNNDMCPA